MTKHYDFNYTFSDTDGINFGGPALNLHNFDLAIYYGDYTEDQYIDCKCSRWDVQDYTMIVETWVKKSDLIRIRNNIVPGAVGELYEILGEPHFFDKTWSNENTLYISGVRNPLKMKTSNLANMRSPKYMYVKNYTEHPITNTDWIEIKLEGYVSSNQLL
jgi:hypothetical protein